MCVCVREREGDRESLREFVVLVREHVYVCVLVV